METLLYVGVRFSGWIAKADLAHDSRNNVLSVKK